MELLTALEMRGLMERKKAVAWVRVPGERYPLQLKSRSIKKPSPLVCVGVQNQNWVESQKMDSRGCLMSREEIEWQDPNQIPKDGLNCWSHLLPEFTFLFLKDSHTGLPVDSDKPMLQRSPPQAHIYPRLVFSQQSDTDWNWQIPLSRVERWSEKEGKECHMTELQ